MDVIDADDFRTWPDALLRALQDNVDSLAAYHRERAAIDLAARDDVRLRLNRLPNVNAPVWHDVLGVANEAVARKVLLGYHATRLTEAEIAGIQSHGLEPLSAKMLERRLGALREAGQSAM